MLNTEENLKNIKALVVGDVMLDEYWFGNATRLSPEAPVPVVQIKNIEKRLGGAANVAHNISSLGGNPILLSVTGDDEAADSLNKIAIDHGIITNFQKDHNISHSL